MKHYTLLAPEVRVQVAEVEYLLVAKKCMITKVRKQMIELSMYKVRWEVSEAPLA